MNLDSPKITDDLAEIMCGLLQRGIYEQFSNMLAGDMPKALRDLEDRLNTKLKTIKKGEDFLGLTVIHAPAKSKTISVFREIDGAEISYPVFDKFPSSSKTIPGLKFDLVRVAVEIRRHINLTKSGDPIFDVINSDLSGPFDEFTIEVAIQRGKYTFRIGGGHDHLRGIKDQYLVGLDLGVPSLRFQGYLAKGVHGGFVLAIDSGLLFPIPLASTGLGLAGLGMKYGERFAPRVSTDGSLDAIEAMRQASAKDYVTWAANSHETTRWIDVDRDLRIYGLKGMIGDLSTKGEVLQAHNVGITYLSYGPTLVLEGYLKILSTEIATLLGAVDIPSKSICLTGSTEIELIPDPEKLFKGSILKFGGSIALSASLIDQTKTWSAFGGYEMNGCRVTVLGGLFEATGGFRIIPLQGAALRAAARIEASARVCGLSGGYSFSIGLMGQIGWNPVEIGGQLDVGGSAWVDIFGRRVGIEVEGHLALQLLQPRKLELSVEYTLDMPWPLWPIKIPHTIFNYDSEKVLAPAANLTLAAAAPLSYVHPCSGTTGELGVETGEVWPDVSFDIPFLRIASGPPLIVNAEQTDGSIEEGGVATTHAISSLLIKKVDETTKAEEVVPNIHAAWGCTRRGEGGATDGKVRTSRLFIPCSDPLAWLQTFDYAQPTHDASIERSWLQTFGVGPDAVLPLSAGVAVFGLDDLRISSTQSFDLVNLPWIAPYIRAISARKLSIEVGRDRGGGWKPFAVIRYDIRCVGYEKTMFRVDGQATALTRVRDLADGLVEWSAIIVRKPASQSKPLQIDGLENSLTIVAVGYVLNVTDQYRPGSQTVLEPALYKLYLVGESVASYNGKAAAPTPWNLTRTFRVILPPSLRPYIRYSSFGDERAFTVSRTGWNPNPSGLGFGHYQGHKGVIRAKVAYLSQIYSRLWIAADRKTPSKPFDWLPAEEQLVFDLPRQAATYVLKVSRRDRPDGADIPIDEWNYRVSAYETPRDHIKPRANRLTSAFGPFGAKGLNVAVTPDLPIDFDFNSVPPMALAPKWLLAPWIRNEPDISHADAALTFLHLFEWSGFFAAQPVIPAVGVTSRPEQADINLLMDAGRNPIGLLIRTSEPADWRRVEAILVYGTVVGSAFSGRFTTRLVPAPDGCSALLLLLAEGMPVRVPRGYFGISFTFHYRLDDLPSLVEAANPAVVAQTFALTFEQPLGRVWDV